MRRVAVCFVAVWACLAGAALAADQPVVKTSLQVVPARVKAGSPAVAVLTLRIRPGHHINVPQPPEKDLMPTRVTLDPSPGLKLVRINWPPGHVVKMPFAGKPLPFYDGTVVVALRLRVGADAKPGHRIIRAKVYYQACDQSSCLLPESVTASGTLEVVK
jgi:DsbC/DsbD-like thiol-disulfide interchange protein